MYFQHAEEHALCGVGIIEQLSDNDVLFGKGIRV